ncbi:hypothetical protein [Pseudooceanicola sp.]|uniref:hypothetical protein n=1 Tax=Pseudooceanicola sp. TaxID=1914328 RepID=UPI00405877BD
MPAAKLTKATMTNALDAIVAAGLTPAYVCVEPDGSFRVEIYPVLAATIEQPAATVEDQPEKFEDLS